MNAASSPTVGAGLALRHAALDLAPLDSAVPSARLHARLVLIEWDYADLARDGELVVSELVTNGIRFARLAPAANGAPPPVRLRLTERHRGVLIEVWDGHDASPSFASRAASPMPRAAADYRWSPRTPPGGAHTRRAAAARSPGPRSPGKTQALAERGLRILGLAGPHLYFDIAQHPQDRRPNPHPGIRRPTGLGRRRGPRAEQFHARASSPWRWPSRHAGHPGPAGPGDSPRGPGLPAPGLISGGG
jgi:anti-sigma regulatory factor (Ser/Thr protein kinase)